MCVLGGTLVEIKLPNEVGLNSCCAHEESTIITHVVVSEEEM